MIILLIYFSPQVQATKCTSSSRGVGIIFEEIAFDCRRLENLVFLESFKVFDGLKKAPRSLTHVQIVRYTSQVILKTKTRFFPL